MLCVLILYMWWDLQFKVDSERQIFEKIFMAIFIDPQSFCQKSAERKSPKKYFFVLCFDFWGSKPSFTSNMLTHYLLHYGGFTLVTEIKMCKPICRDTRHIVNVCRTKCSLNLTLIT